MPRQVYGKKSRAIYDPSSIFGAQKSSPSDAREIRIPEVAEEIGSLHVTRKKNKDRGGSRRVLKEKEANVVSAEGAVKRRSRVRTKVVVDEQDDEDEDEARSEGTAIHRPTEGRRFEDNHAVACDSVAQAVDISIDIPSIQSDDAPTKSARMPTFPRLPITPDSSPPKQSTISIPTPSATPQPETSIRDHYTRYCAPLLSHSNHSLVDFSTWTSQLTPHFHLSKIAEASFGEVYRLSLRAPLPEFEKGDESVFKVIALAPPAAVTGDKETSGENVSAGWMSSIENVTNEVRLLQRMSSIPGFTNFRDVRIVQGRPPVQFVEAFHAFETAQRASGKGGSHFPDPGREASYPHDQLWAVLEMQDAGTDLEKVVESRSCRSILRVWDVFWQVVLSLAKGEEAAEFEHRDLHLGNICVRGTATSCDAAAEIDLQRTLGFTGLETTIIDYTISRAAMQNGTTAYQDLARDDGLFEGDSEEEYQYEIYRYMRGAVLYGDSYAAPPFPTSPAEEVGWEGFHPISNLVWLHFVLYKLLEQVVWPSAVKAPGRKRKLEYARWKRSGELEGVLLRVQELLDPGVLCEEGLKSACDLVGLALEEGWLRVEDVVGEQMVGVDEVDDVVERLGGLEIRGYATKEEQEEVQTVPTQTTPRMKARARQ